MKKRAQRHGRAQFQAARPLLAGPRLLVLSMPLLLLSIIGCDKPIAKVGVVLPLSGPDAALGQAAKEGLEASFADLADTPVQLEIVDSESDSTKAAAQASTLIENGAVALVGGVTPTDARSLATVAADSERVVILTSASEQALTRDSKWVYRLSASDADAGAAFATFAAHRFKNKSAAILASDPAYAAGIQEGFTPTFTSLGGEIVYTFEGGSEDLGAATAKTRKLAPEVAVIAGDAPWQKQTAKALRKSGFQGVIFAGRHLAHPEVIAEAAEIKDLLFAHSGFDHRAIQGSAKSFTEAFESHHGRKPEAVTAQVAAEAWDALRVLDLALRDRPALAGEVRRGLRDQVKSFAGASGSLEFDDLGEVTSFPRVYSFTADGGLRDHGDHLDEETRRIAEQRRALQAKLQNLQSQMTQPSGSG